MHPPSKRGDVRLQGFQRDIQAQDVDLRRAEKPQPRFLRQRVDQMPYRSGRCPARGPRRRGAPAPAPRGARCRDRGPEPLAVTISEGTSAGEVRMRREEILHALLHIGQVFGIGRSLVAAARAAAVVIHGRGTPPEIAPAGELLAYVRGADDPVRRASPRRPSPPLGTCDGRMPRAARVHIPRRARYTLPALS